jgi:hypothetical protein
LEKKNTKFQGLEQIYTKPVKPSLRTETFASVPTLRKSFSIYPNYPILVLDEAERERGVAQSNSMKKIEGKDRGHFICSRHMQIIFPFQIIQGHTLNFPK